MMRRPFRAAGPGASETMNQQPSEKIHFGQDAASMGGRLSVGQAEADMARVVDFPRRSVCRDRHLARTDHAQPAPQHDPAPSARSPRGAARVLLLDGRGLGRALCHRDAQAGRDPGRGPCRTAAAHQDRAQFLVAPQCGASGPVRPHRQPDRPTGPNPRSAVPTTTAPGIIFYGGSYVSGQAAIAPPRALLSPLKLAGGLRILVHGDPTFMVMETLKRQFEQIVGTDIHQRAFSIDRLHQETLRNAERKRSAYDLIAVDLPWIGELVTKGVIRPLTEVPWTSTGSISGDFHTAGPGARPTGTACPTAVPSRTTPELMFYPKDMGSQATDCPPPFTSDDVDRRRPPFPRSARGPLRGGPGTRGAAGTAPAVHTFMMTCAAFRTADPRLCRNRPAAMTLTDFFWCSARGQLLSYTPNAETPTRPLSRRALP